jgi:hypothetical protein
LGVTLLSKGAYFSSRLQSPFAQQGRAITSAMAPCSIPHATRKARTFVQIINFFLRHFIKNLKKIKQRPITFLKLLFLMIQYSKSFLNEIATI